MQKRVKRVGKVIVGLVTVLVVVYFLGPRPDPIQLDPKIADTELSLATIDSLIQVREGSISNIKPGNEACIYWADSSKKQTKYALVYLHGFSASRGEGDPIHLDMARRYGMNAFLSRLDQHGKSDDEPLLNLTPEGLVETAKEAINIGNILGEKVIVMSCSTGGTLALYLASENPEKIDGLICYSPNVDLYSSSSRLIDGPWGMQITRLAEGGNYHSWEATDSVKNYWNTTYRIEALIALRQLVDATMADDVFDDIMQPLLVLYYYKNDEEMDKTVSIEAAKEMFVEVGTPVSQKQIFPVPNAGEHVIGSKYVSEDLATVTKYTVEFLESVMKLRPIE